MVKAAIGVAAAMAFSLPMLLARLSIGTVATVSTGFLATRIAPRSRLHTVKPGGIPLLPFIPPQHPLGDGFPLL